MFERKVLPLMLLLVPLFSISQASAQAPSPSAPVRDDGGTEDAYDSDPRVQAWRRRQEQEALRKKEAEKRKQGHALQEKGSAYYKKQDWANAIKCFAGAARLKPGSSAIKKGLKDAKAQLRRQLAARSSRVSQLSDKQLDAEIARLRKNFVKMKGDFQADVKDLQHWARQSQEAQRAAIKTSTDALLGALMSKAVKKLEASDPAFKKRASKIHDAAAKLQEDLTKAGGAYAKSSRDREAKLQAAHSVLRSAYDLLSEYDDKIDKVSKAAGPAVDLASYVVSYAEHATKWNVARGQIRMVHDNLDRPGGKLAAQKALQKFHEALFRERNRRRALRK